MFTHHTLATLNELEMQVYHFVIKNRESVMYMTIRELADAAQVSTTTILRFCRKMQCEGYSEFRIRFKLYLEQEKKQAGQRVSARSSVFSTALIMRISKTLSMKRCIILWRRSVSFLLARARPAH